MRDDMCIICTALRQSQAIKRHQVTTVKRRFIGFDDLLRWDVPVIMIFSLDPHAALEWPSFCSASMDGIMMTMAVRNQKGSMIRTITNVLAPMA